MDGNLAMANQLERPDLVYRQRIIFVGVHNKPGFAPLDSRTTLNLWLINIRL